MPPKSRSGARRRAVKKNVAQGHAYIKSTFNNTIVSITDPSGAVPDGSVDLGHANRAKYSLA